MQFAYLNGEYVEAKKATVSVNDRCFLYGDGVFETVRSYQGQLFLLDQHLQRLQRSLQQIYLELPLPLTTIKVAAKKLVELNWQGQDMLLRLTVSRGSGEGLWPEKTKPLVVMQTRALPLDLKQKISQGVKVVISETRRNFRLALNPEVKSCNFLNNILALREAKIKGAAESLMLNYQGYLTEGAVSNLFIVAENGSIYTPPVTDGLLPGITRELILKLAKAKGFLIQEKRLTLADLFQALEAFLTLTSAGLLPIVKVDNRLLGSGQPGRVTKALINFYHNYVAKFLAGKEDEWI